MKAVLISIQPQWCKKIISGEKTIEIRKSSPKLETPFKVYIYCAYGQELYADYPHGIISKVIKLGGVKVSGKNHIGNMLNGKVIGEFVCDKTDFFFADYYDNGSADLTPSRLIFGLGNANSELAYLDKCCLTHDELFDYIISGKYGHGWHISDLKIYDNSKKLSDFGQKCKYAKYQDDEMYGGWFCGNEYIECDWQDCPSCGGESCGYEDYAYCMCNGLKPLTRPPQSWCYVEQEK